MPDRTEYPAKLVGRDEASDIAVLKIDAGKTLPFVKLGDSTKTRVGDWVMAIGNPLGLGGTVTSGIVSALYRNVGQGGVDTGGAYDRFIQTDAAINQGNSGGPMFNLNGEVIGINTAILSGQASAANIGIGFAIPINIVRQLLPQLREGKVSHGRIGVQITDVRSEAAEAFGLENRDGAVVTTVESGGPADDAGLEPGDVIVDYNGQLIKSTNELVQIVLRTKPGTIVPLTINVARSLEVVIPMLASVVPALFCHCVRSAV